MKRHRYKPWNAPDAEIKAKNKADVLILLHVVKEKNLEINKKKKLSRKRNYKNEIKEISEVGTTVSEKKMLDGLQSRMDMTGERSLNNNYHT